MERLFNAIPYTLQSKSDISADAFKGHLDKWLRTIPETLKIDNYGIYIPSKTNSLYKQAKQVGDPNSG